MHAARPRRGQAADPHRAPLDAKYSAIARAMASLGARQAYLDGELCGVGPDGITSFNMVQLASDSGNAAALVFFLFDLLFLHGEDRTVQPLIERNERLAALLANAERSLHYGDHQIGHGRAFHERACKTPLEGILSKRTDAPRNRGLGRKVKCLHRQDLSWSAGPRSANHRAPEITSTSALLHP